MRRLRPSRGGLSSGQQAVSLQAASLLLGYPEPELVAQVPLLRAAASLLTEVAEGSAVKISVTSGWAIMALRSVRRATGTAY